MKKTNFLLLIAFVFFLMSCRNELDTIQENEKFKTEAKFSLLRKEQVNQQVNLLSKLSEIESKGFKTNNIIGKSVQDSVLEGAIINTDEVLLAERGEKKTYTFPVYRTNSDKIENLVLKENADKTYSGFLIQYALTKQERDLFISGHDVDIKSKIKIFNIDKLNLSSRIQTDVVGCYEITWETGTCSSSYHHEYGDNTCTLTGDNAAPKPTIIAIKDICSNYSNQTDGPNTNPNIPNDGSSGSYDTAPYIGSEAELIEMNRVFRLKLSAAHLSWYDAHTVLGIDLAKLYNEDSSVPHLNFLKSLIDYMKTSNNTGDTFLYATIINFLKQEGSYQENWTLISNILAEHNPGLGIAVLNFLIQNPDTTLVQFQPFYNFFKSFLANNPNANNYFSQNPYDLEKIKFEAINYNNANQVKMANALAPIFTELLIAEQNNAVSQINIQNPAWKFAKDYMIYLIKENTPEAIKYGRIIYEHSNKYFKTHPNALQKINEFIEFMKVNVMAEVPIEQNPHYMKWTDILLCWLFEIGDFPVNDSAGYGNLPTLGFAGSDYTISGQPTPYVIPMRYLSAHNVKNGVADPTSVSGLRNQSIQKIKQGDLSPTDGEWVFGSSATVDTIVKLDGMQFCIGSYHTNVYVTALGGNQYKLTFVIKNKTGWTSGTRGLNDYNGDPTDDSVIPDQPRGTGVHLGGTIAETFGWYEIITVN